MVKLKDIANACGVSTATVSRALNGQTNPDKKNASYIRQKAKEMGYFPNAAARTLKTSRSYNLGVLFADENSSGLTHPFFAAVLNAFKAEAERHGYDDRRDHRGEREQDGSRQLRRERREHVLARHVARSHVAGEQPAEPVHVLHEERLVEPELVALGVDELLRDRDALVLDDRRHRIAARQVHQPERQQRYAQQDGNKLQQPMDDILPHFE